MPKNKDSNTEGMESGQQTLRWLMQGPRPTAGAWKGKACDLMPVKTDEVSNALRTAKAVYPKIDGFFKIQLQHALPSPTGEKKW